MKITKEQAKKAWQEIKDNQFIRTIFPKFRDYWRECERFNCEKYVWMETQTTTKTYIVPIIKKVIKTKQF